MSPRGPVDVSLLQLFVAKIWLVIRPIVFHPRLSSSVPSLFSSCLLQVCLWAWTSDCEQGAWKRIQLGFWATGQIIWSWNQGSNKRNLLFRSDGNTVLNSNAKGNSNSSAALWFSREAAQPRIRKTKWLAPEEGTACCVHQIMSSAWKMFVFKTLLSSKNQSNLQYPGYFHEWKTIFL